MMAALPMLAVALAVGLMIGIERGWRSRNEPAGSRVAGVRTFGLLGLLGGLLGLIAAWLHPLAAIVVLGFASAALLIGYGRDMIRDGHVSVTTTIAALLTLCLGLLATSGYAVLATVTAAVTTLLLSMRDQLHGWLKGLSDVEIQAFVRFAVIAAAVLPLLPDRRYGPLDAWNPRELWLVVILVTGFSFAGYLANRRFGATRGTLATAAIGGLYSSTAVTAALSRRLREGDGQRPLLAAGIALASALMFLRVLVLTGILARSALPSLATIVGPAALVAALLGAWSVRRSSGVQAAVEVRATNPFELLPALGFAAVVAALALASRWAEREYGDTGIATLIAITGAFDVDAAIVTMGGLPAGAIAPRLAGVVLAVPVLLNTLFKAGIVVATAGWSVGVRAAMPLLASSAAMIAALAISL